ncbi:hypothetical protein TRFO_13290 [Tritrichomonas foetus]|uniref:Uncharacterized protein n=1 Tax=Tritrichomonas foetus TaxID=1144522 RepID=A0A1J4L2T4_9EUKA|nr:hypothetical protein TRFO_13290 [Tritrichomonas foetus]|eukprot:OHT16284.1 hypothetical protein TRFO_13290 [Tritrichomonas foetus]
MFFKKYDELSANLARAFRSKKNLLETAAQFADLAAMQDQDNPFQYGLIGLAHFGEMRCYKKLEDSQKLIRTAIVAARYFKKSAYFNYEISKSLRNTWAEPLADGIQCYRTAIAALKATEKYNLAITTLNELAEIEEKFEFFHYAGNSYEESVRLCIEHAIRPRLFIDTLLKCVSCYVKCDRFDLSLIIMMSAAVQLETDYSNVIDLSTLLKAQFNELIAAKAALLICNAKFGEARTIATTQLAGSIGDFLIKYIANVQKSESPSVIKKSLQEANQGETLPPLLVLIVERHCPLLEKTVEYETQMPATLDQTSIV